MEGSPSWQRLRDGIPTEITDLHLRRMFHDYANVTTTLVGELDRALNEIDTLHDRLDRRSEAHEALKDDLFNPKDGYFIEAKKYVDEKFGKFTGPLFVLIGSVMSGLVLLAANRFTSGS